MAKKKSILEQFREFAVKGNALDLAVGVIIGAAFGKIIDSLVKDIIMPPLGLITGKIDFSNKYILLGPGDTVGPDGNVLTVAQAQKLGPVLAYGQFVNNIISFVIVAFAVFMLVKLANKIRHDDEKQPEPAKEDPNEKNIAQNARMIELLENIAGKNQL